MSDLDDLGDGSLDELAARYAVTVGTARRWVTGAARRIHDPQTIVALYLAGRTQAPVAAEVGCGTDTVSKDLGDAGVARRTTPRLDLAEIARRAAAGQTLGEIVAALGASKGGVWAAMAPAGIPPKAPGSLGRVGRRGPPAHGPDQTRAH